MAVAPRQRSSQMEPPPPSNEPWFWGTAPRAELDDAVRAGGKGDFAIREDRDGHYSLTVNDGSDLSRYKVTALSLSHTTSLDVAVLVTRDRPL